MIGNQDIADIGTHIFSFVFSILHHHPLVVHFPSLSDSSFDVGAGGGVVGTCITFRVESLYLYLHVGVIAEPALHNLLLQHHLRHQNVCHLSSTWCQISIIIIALLLISTLKARIFMIKSISIILTRVTWSSFLEAAPELSYYQNIIWKWRRCWISHWLSTLSVGISLSISNFEQQIGNPHRKFKQQGCEIIVSYNMGKTQEHKKMIAKIFFPLGATRAWSLNLCAAEFPHYNSHPVIINSHDQGGLTTVISDCSSTLIRFSCRDLTYLCASWLLAWVPVRGGEPLDCWDLLLGLVFSAFGDL